MFEIRNSAIATQNFEAFGYSLIETKQLTLM